MAKVGGRDITVEQIRKYQEKDRKKHPDKYLDFEDITKRDIRRIRKEIWDKFHKRKKYPRGIWQHHQNISLAAQIAIDDKRRRFNRQKRCPECKREFEYNRIFRYPDQDDIMKKSKFSTALAYVVTLMEFYKVAGCFDPESDYYDPLLETFPQIVTEDKIGCDVYEVSGSFKDERNIENTIRKLNALSIIAATTDKEIGDLQAKDMQKYKCNGMLAAYNSSVWALLKSVGFKSNLRFPNHYWTENNYENLWSTLDDVVSDPNCSLFDYNSKIVLARLRDIGLGHLLNVIEKNNLSDKFYEKYGGRSRKEPGFWLDQNNRFKFYEQLETSGKKVTAITAASAYIAVQRSRDIDWETEMQEYAAHKTKAKSF